MSIRYKTISKYLNHVEHLLILASKITCWVSISAFASLVAIPVGISSPAIEIKISAITGGTKMYKSNIKKKKKKNNKIVLLGRKNK